MNKKFVIIGIVVLAIIGIIFSKMTGTSGIREVIKTIGNTDFYKNSTNLNRSCDDVTITHENGDKGHTGLKLY